MHIANSNTSIDRFRECNVGFSKQKVEASALLPLHFSSVGERPKGRPCNKYVGRRLERPRLQLSPTEKLFQQRLLLLQDHIGHSQNRDALFSIEVGFAHAQAPRDFADLSVFEKAEPQNVV